MPFPDACFDLVVMNQVIEHVADQSMVVREAARVVREGGAIYIACPNYLRFYEPHYKIFWAPLLPKTLGRIYLRLRGRSPAMLNQLTYTTNRRLRKLLAELGPGLHSFRSAPRAVFEKAIWPLVLRQDQRAWWRSSHNCPLSVR